MADKHDLTAPTTPTPTPTTTTQEWEELLGETYDPNPLLPIGGNFAD